MNTKRTLILAALMAALAAGPGWFATHEAIAAGPPAGRPARTQPLSTGEAATLSFMREEEKLARDVYLNLDKAWDLPPFQNIATSEQRHMDTLKGKLDKYGLPDPANPALIGWFANPELAALYVELMGRGETSYLEALRVGGLIEEVDIDDLAQAIAATTHPDLVQVYNNLMRGSRNHLRAFAAEIERQGAVYEALYLEQEVVDAIIDTPMERGK
jgi:hypothetical protein